MVKTMAVVGLLSKLVGLGLAGLKASKSGDLDVSDLSAIKELLATIPAIAAIGSESRSNHLAHHMSMIHCAFGEAWRRHWGVEPSSGKDPLSWNKRVPFFKSSAQKEMEARVKFAVTKVVELGTFSSVEHLQSIQNLVSDPRKTIYYQALWDAFTNEKLVEDENVLLLCPQDETDFPQQEFERHFLLAYAEALAMPRGEEVRRYLQSLKEYEQDIVQDFLLRDLLSWRAHQAFGNTSEIADDLPDMPLERIYVQPNVLHSNEELLQAIYDKCSNSDSLIIVRAQFGFGKSLSARTLAWELAEEYLDSRNSVPQINRLMPVFVDCGKFLTSGHVASGDCLDKIVRAAHKNRLSMLGYKIKSTSTHLAINDDQRTLFILDGLDEAALTQSERDTLLKHLVDDVVGDGHSVVIFSRPAGLPRDIRFHDVLILDIAPFDDEQIEHWLNLWGEVSDAGKGVSLTLDKIRQKGRDILELSRTPILLFMISFSWQDFLSKEEERNVVRLYRHFFQTIARSKYERSKKENHPAVAKASERIQEALQNKYNLDTPRPEDAMLWMLSRLAWEEDIVTYLGKGDLSSRQLDNILRDELGIDNDEDEELASNGVLLALNTESSGRHYKIRFRHKSFREYLVAHFWATTILHVSSSNCRQGDYFESILMSGRLLQYESNAFGFLSSMLNDKHAVTDKQRSQVGDWCLRQFRNESIENSRDARVFRTSLRPNLREVGLAISSDLGEQSKRLELDEDKLKLRSLIAWGWLNHPIFISALNADLSGIDLSYANLKLSVFEGSSLAGANLVRANLFSAVLRGCQLCSLHLHRLLESDFSATLETLLGSRFELELGMHDATDLSWSDLRHADMVNANMVGVKLCFADLVSANLKGADMKGANLKGARFGRPSILGFIDDACLENADLRGVFAEGVDFCNVDLTEADLSGAYLFGANMNHARLNNAKLVGADLTGAKLIGADLCGADLSDAVLADVVLSGVDDKEDVLAVFVQAKYDRSTKWPLGFDPKNAGAIIDTDIV